MSRAIVSAMHQPEQPSPQRVSIELDTSSPQISGLVLTERDKRRFYGWIQLAALLNEINAEKRGDLSEN